MKEKLLFIVLLMTMAITEFFPDVFAQDPKAKAMEILNRAQKAIGGEKLDSITSLTVTGNYRRLLGEREMNGEIRIDMLMPDKIMKTETMVPIPSIEITRIETLNGDNYWTDQESSGSGGAMVMIRRGGDDTPEGEQLRLNAFKAELARLSIGWLLKTPSNIPVEFSFLGKAESPDGNADVIGVGGPANFNSRLFIDQKTGMPLMMTYNGRKPRIITSTVSGPRRSREELEKHVKESEKNASMEPEVEYQVHFSQYRSVKGISFPFHISKSIEGEVNEEWQIKDIKVNPDLKTELFIKK